MYLSIKRLFEAHDVYPILLIMFVIILITAAVVDYRTQKIPNILNGVALLAALITWTLLEGWSGFLFSFKGFWVGLSTLIIPYALGAMGGGDVKLMGVVGAFLGIQGVLNAFVLTSLCGGLYAVGLIVVHPRQFWKSMQRYWLTFKLLVATKKFTPDKPVATAPRLYYGIAIAVGTLSYLLLDLAGVDPLI